MNKHYLVLLKVKHIHIYGIRLSNQRLAGNCVILDDLCKATKIQLGLLTN